MQELMTGERDAFTLLLLLSVYGAVHVVCTCTYMHIHSQRYEFTVQIKVALKDSSFYCNIQSGHHHNNNSRSSYDLDRCLNFRSSRIPRKPVSCIILASHCYPFQSASQVSFSRCFPHSLSSRIYLLLVVDRRPTTRASTRTAQHGPLSMERIVSPNRTTITRGNKNA